MRQVAGHREGGVVLGRRHLHDPRPERLPQRFDRIHGSRLGCFCWCHNRDPSFEQVGPRCFRPRSFTAGNRMAADKSDRGRNAGDDLLLRAARISNDARGGAMGGDFDDVCRDRFDRRADDCQLGRANAFGNTSRDFSDAAGIERLVERALAAADADNPRR